MIERTLACVFSLDRSFHRRQICLQRRSISPIIQPIAVKREETLRFQSERLKRFTSSRVESKVETTVAVDALNMFCYFFQLWVSSAYIKEVLRQSHQSRQSRIQCMRAPPPQIRIHKTRHKPSAPILPFVCVLFSGGSVDLSSVNCPSLYRDKGVSRIGMEFLSSEYL